MALLASAYPSAYHDIARSGKMFVGISGTPLAIPKYDATAIKFALWNPLGSGVNAVLVRYTAGVAAGNCVPGNIQFMYVGSTGSLAATGLPVAAVTVGTPVSTLIGTYTGKCTFSVALTLTTAGTQFYGSGISNLTTTLTAAGASGYTQITDFFETVQIPPGVVFYTAAQAATVSTFNETLVWYEEAA